MNRYFAGPSRKITDVKTQLIAKCRDKRRHGDFGSAVEGRRGQRHFLFVEQPVGVFDRHRRIVDENADRKGEATQCHRIDGLAEEIEHNERGQHRQRDRDHDDDRRPPRAEE